MPALRLIAPLLLALSLALTGCATTSDDPTADWSASRLYSEAKQALDAGNYASAIEYYETLEARFPFGRFAQQAQLEIAYAYFKFGEIDSANAAIDRFLKLNPRHPYVDYAHYLRGLSNVSRGESLLFKIFPQDRANFDASALEQAFNDFAVVVRRFPDGPYAEDARLRMLELREILARNELKIADYYWRRGAYVAVVNRCEYVLEFFQGSAATRDALELMARAYERLELPELAADTRRVLELNYPAASEGG
jgi:outer membrane protein assembly factor BamD